MRAIKPERGVGAREGLLGVKAREVVVTAAGADAAKLGQLGQERLVNAAGIVIEAAADRQVDEDALLGYAGFRRHVEQLPQAFDPFGRVRVAAELLFNLIELLGVRPRRLRE